MEEDTGYFKGTANREFIDYYKVDLYSRMEITLYTYPHEFAEEDPIPWEHFSRCEQILYEHLYDSYQEPEYHRRLPQNEGSAQTAESDGADTDLGQTAMAPSAEERAAGYAAEQHAREAAVKAKMQELAPELARLRESYLQQVKLTFVDL